MWSAQQKQQPQDQIEVEQLPANNNQNYYGQQAGGQQMQQGVPVNQMNAPYQQQQMYPMHPSLAAGEGAMIVQVQPATQKHYQLRQYCHEFKKMCECWMYVLAFLVILSIINVGLNVSNDTLYLVSEGFSIIEYFLWMYGSQQGKVAMDSGQIERLQTSIKAIYYSIPPQVIGTITRVVFAVLDNEEGSTRIIYAMIFLAIEIYMGYYKLWKYIPLTKELQSLLNQYQERRTHQDPTLQQLLQGVVLIQD